MLDLSKADCLAQYRTVVVSTYINLLTTLFISIFLKPLCRGILVFSGISL